MTKCGLFRWLVPVVALAAMGCHQQYSDEIERSASLRPADPALAATRGTTAPVPAPDAAAATARRLADAPA